MPASRAIASIGRPMKSMQSADSAAAILSTWGAAIQSPLMRVVTIDQITSY